MSSEREKQEYLKDNQRKSAEITPPNRGIFENASRLCCPQCGSSRIRKRSRYLVISIVVFASLLFVVRVYGVLAVPVLSALDRLVESNCFPSFVFGFMSSAWMTLGLALLPIMMIWPVVICAAACFAFVGSHRCRSCGHRFRPTRAPQQTKAEARFPWAFCVLNGVLLLLLCIVGPIVMRAQSANGNLHETMRLLGRGLDDMMALLSGIFVFLWSLGPSLVCQALAHRLLKRKITSRAIWGILFLLPAITIGGGWFYCSTPIAQARATLARGELARLPKSATDIRVYMWSSPFSGEEFLRFRATPEDIEKFLKESPILRGAKCRKYSKDRMRLKQPEDYWQRLMEYREDQHEYFHPDPSTPDWYKQEIRSPARSYMIRPKRYHYPGEVLIDDEENLVFVYLCFS